MEDHDKRKGEARWKEEQNPTGWVERAHGNGVAGEADTPQFSRNEPRGVTRPERLFQPFPQRKAVVDRVVWEVDSLAKQNGARSDSYQRQSAEELNPISPHWIARSKMPLSSPVSLEASSP